MCKEGEYGHQLGEPIVPSPLPPDLAAFLKTQPVACLMHPTHGGAAHVIKLPAREIDSVRGRVPIQVRHELYAHTAAPVIRAVPTIYDQPERPPALETMTNVVEADQREDFARLGSQERLLLLFYDENLTHRLSKTVGNVESETIEKILTQADAVRRHIPPEQYDFMC